MLASSLSAIGNYLVLNRRAPKEQRINRSGGEWVPEDPEDGSMMMQAREASLGVDWGVREREE